MRQSRMMLAAAIAASMAMPAVYSAPAIGSGVPNPRDRNRDRSRYMPHQGPREIARRLRQADRLASREQPA